MQTGLEGLEHSSGPMINAQNRYWTVRDSPPRQSKGALTCAGRFPARWNAIAVAGLNAVLRLLTAVLFRFSECDGATGKK